MPIAGLIITLIFIAGTFWIKYGKAGPDEGHCANCGYDLRASLDRCPECGMPFHRVRDHIPLRDDWPADALSLRKPAPDEEPVVIYLTDSIWEARTLADQFDARGIWAKVIGPPVIADANYSYSNVKVMGSYRVVVWSGDQELAAELRDKLITQKPIQHEDRA